MIRLHQLTALAPALALAAVLCSDAMAQGCPPGQQQQTLTVSNSFGPQAPPWNGLQLTVPKFDPALGTLISAKVTATGSIQGSIQIENLAPQALNVTANLSSNLAVTGPIPQLLMTPTSSISQNFGAYDGNTDFRGPSGGSFFNLTAQDSEMATITDPAVLLASYTGPGNVVFTHNAQDGSNHDGPGSLALIFLNQSKVDISIVYTYCADLPKEGPCAERHRRQCGSLLLYPEFDNRPGIVTLFTVTDGCCDVTAGNVLVEYRFINKDNCLKTDQTFTLTPCDTLSFITSAPGVNSGGPNKRGYAYVYAKSATTSPNNPTGTPIVWNHMIGQQLILNGITMVNYSMNAVSFKGIGPEGAFNDDDGDGIRDLNGPTLDGGGPNPLAEYEEAPDEILIPRFLGQDLAAPGGPNLYNSDVILVNLSGGSAFTTIVDILGYNDNEDPLSAQYEFYCWDKPKLRDFAEFTLESSLDLNPTNDPDEIVGAPTKESGWLRIDGLVANSSGPEAILDPAIYAVLVECTNNLCAADLPWERCSQRNGDLLPNSIFGDGPNPVAGDNQ